MWVVVGCQLVVGLYNLWYLHGLALRKEWDGRGQHCQTASIPNTFWSHPRFTINVCCEHLLSQKSFVAITSSCSWKWVLSWSTRWPARVRVFSLTNVFYLDKQINHWTELFSKDGLGPLKSRQAGILKVHHDLIDSSIWWCRWYIQRIRAQNATYPTLNKVGAGGSETSRVCLTLWRWYRLALPQRIPLCTPAISGR